MKNLPAIVVVGLLCLWLSAVAAMTAWTDAEIDWLASHVKGSPVDVHWGWSLCLAALPPTSPLLLPFNIGVEIYAACQDD